MLETLPRVSVTQDVHRFANFSHLPVFAAKKGLMIDEVTDVIAFAPNDVVAELMKSPFQRKPLLGNKFGLVSRFSDGEWPVFYAAIGRTTAEKESTHHYARKAAGDAAARRGVHYSIVRCRFSGEIIDLRPKLGEWPRLISDDYTFCNGLGKEAHDEPVDGFLAPSARNAGGTTVPAFMEGTLSDPLIEAAAKLRFDEGDTVVEVKELLQFSGRPNAIITTDANELLADIHDRMPVVLARRAIMCAGLATNPTQAAMATFARSWRRE